MRLATPPFVALACLLAAPIADAGRIADLFSEGLFGLKWGATREAIEAAFPGGRWQKTPLDQRYWVYDSRPVLGVDRSDKSRFGFVLNPDGHLYAVTIEFASGGIERWDTLLLRFDEAFGPRTPTAAFATNKFGIGIVGAEWAEDEGVLVRAFDLSKPLPGGMDAPVGLTISKASFGPDKTKEELGFK